MRKSKKSNAKAGGVNNSDAIKSKKNKKSSKQSRNGNSFLDRLISDGTAGTHLGMIGILRRLIRARRAYHNEFGGNIQKEFKRRHLAIITETQLDTTVKTVVREAVSALRNLEKTSVPIEVDKKAYPLFKSLLETSEEFMDVQVTHEHDFIYRLTLKESELL